MPSTDTHFDLVIIGTGSGNTILDERFESWRVAIVERAVFGGTCINHGCVPTKMFVYPADLAAAARDAGRFGVDMTVDGSDGATSAIGSSTGSIPISIDGERYRNSQPNVSVVRGDARFTAPRTLEVVDGDRSTTLTADRFVIAAGARPVVPDIEGIEAVGYETSETVMRVDEVPERLVVIGGGFIAAELSHVFGSFGSDVTIVTRGDLMISHHDHDVATAFTALQSKRFTLHRNATVNTAKRVGDWIELTLADGTPLIADTILVAHGPPTQQRPARPRCRRRGHLIRRPHRHRRHAAHLGRRRVGARRHPRPRDAQARGEPRGRRRPPQPAASRRTATRRARTSRPTRCSRAPRSRRSG